ncbi:hypothetical protein TNCV_3863991 [Trichonephila clavipes]|nr:hypothetical protein TNCV_3863991 [Trichonephila clavipes]
MLTNECAVVFTKDPFPIRNGQVVSPEKVSQGGHLAADVFKGSPPLTFLDLADRDIKVALSLSSLLNYLRAFGDGPVAGVPGDQGIE